MTGNGSGYGYGDGSGYGSDYLPTYCADRRTAGG